MNNTMKNIVINIVNKYCYRYDALANIGQDSDIENIGETYISKEFPPTSLTIIINLIYFFTIYTVKNHLSNLVCVQKPMEHTNVSNNGPVNYSTNASVNHCKYVPPIVIDDPTNILTPLENFSKISNTTITGKMLLNNRLKIFPPTDDAHPAMQRQIKDEKSVHTLLNFVMKKS
ncbi:hypothetical protein AVEN_150286-1 [Araneus ventricosus]|uniref:Uncharacterized protein n=1 Tax=Araneus ventricosus TaxID=182803 RepID=A0A4Y2TBE9_ARAVE|nr:hypothetical protein AVEN_113570-1 [Araneus ventricosus]GBN97944.1 hypothetical protein AVEN_173059-1 [Araneus ventricosus]GBN97974.1 hypothetical protein AVEN_180344-1 [Araneus ventricosus]GBN98003.1 hypothetical protein AVEN_150286-1 [Araneus ventricosus]